MLNEDYQLKFTEKKYPIHSPFNPPKIYPEYPYTDIDKNNMIYDAIRDLLRTLKLDEKNYGTKEWNPLGDLIKPGDKVVIKPNFVSEPRSEKIDYQSIITHPSIIRPIIDYCNIALKGQGELAIADAPQFDSNFEKIKEITQIDNLIEYVSNQSEIKIELIDLRQEIVEIENGIITNKIIRDGDPKGYTIINLKEESAFSSIENYTKKIYGSDYDFKETRKHHSGGNHEYCISNTILDADVIINIPKLKTHKKAGITVCQKNLVGINTNKNYLPHFRFGSKEEGGDEYYNNTKFKSIKSDMHHFSLDILSKITPKQRKILKPLGRIYSKIGNKSNLKFESGDWHGNDTIWRTIVDLNKILLYSDKNGLLNKDIQRKYLAIVDGIIGGEKNGPHFPDPKPCGVLIGGFNPVLVDMVSAEIMGFDWRKIPSIVHFKSSLTKKQLENKNISEINLEFKPPKHWENIIKQ